MHKTQRHSVMSCCKANSCLIASEEKNWNIAGPPPSNHSPDLPANHFLAFLFSLHLNMHPEITVNVACS